MDGCRVEFNLLVRITKLDKLLYESVKATILRQEKFRLPLLKKICRALLFRCEFSLPQDSVILTAEGGMNLKGAVLTGANLTSENLCDADLSGANLEGQCCLWRIVKVQILRAQIYREHH